MYSVGFGREWIGWALGLVCLSATMAANSQNALVSLGRCLFWGWCQFDTERNVVDGPSHCFIAQRTTAIRSSLQLKFRLQRAFTNRYRVGCQSDALASLNTKAW